MLFLYYLHIYGYVAAGLEDYLNSIYFVFSQMFLCGFE